MARGAVQSRVGPVQGPGTARRPGVHRRVRGEQRHEELDTELTRLFELHLSRFGAWLFGKATTIYGGSTEIQNNIIAKRVLGMLDHQ